MSRKPALALHGGAPVKTVPYGSGPKHLPAEKAAVNAVLDRGALTFSRGPEVMALLVAHGIVRTGRTPMRTPPGRAFRGSSASGTPRARAAWRETSSRSAGSRTRRASPWIITPFRSGDFVPLSSTRDTLEFLARFTAFWVPSKQPIQISSPSRK